MKLLSKYMTKECSGRVVLIPDDNEDMWHIYNLIQEGDNLKATTFRKVTIESATGTTGSNRVRTTLTICIESVEYDTQGSVIRVKGKNIVENQYVKMGQYHTLDIELNRKFTLSKAYWDSIALDRLELACDPTQSADLGAVIMQPGLAHICLVTPSMTLIRAKIDVNIPRKRKSFCAQHEKGLQKFFEAISQGLLRHMNFEIVKCILLASPGFVKDQFFEYMCQMAVKNDIKVLLENKNKFVLCHSSSGFKHSLKEVLSDPLLQSRLADTKAASEVKTLQTFYTTLQNEPSKAFYGIKHVEKANECQAIETLLISDKLFRCSNIADRKRFVLLVDSVKDNGGEVRLFSSLHISGEQLDQLTGVAAILRFPMQELDDEPDDSSSDED
ncbi:protein pelota-like [Oppia nitens]|uniref:protein pelota-like n=1 Tax=Oppia nitens TaxID=1686743 RepID=UPI0023DAD3BC|nr:protein pelota-like [Oppia nitens]